MSKIKVFVKSTKDKQSKKIYWQAETTIKGIVFKSDIAFTTIDYLNQTFDKYELIDDANYLIEQKPVDTVSFEEIEQNQLLAQEYVD